MIEYLHAMIRTRDPQQSVRFYTDGLGLQMWRKNDYEDGRFSLYFVGEREDGPMIELTHNWDDRDYAGGDQFGHLAFRTDNVYELCQHLMDMGVDILRPPRDGYMAFVKDPNGISIELLQRGERLPPAAPWSEMENQGSW